MKYSLKSGIKKRIKHGTPLWRVLKTLSPESIVDAVIVAGFKTCALPARNRQWVISSMDSGICNRIKCLVSSMRLAELFSRNLLLYWPQHALCGCSFGDLFENSVTQVDDRMFRRMSRRAWADRDIALVYTWRLLVQANELGNGFAQAFPSTGGNAIDFEYNRIPKALINEYLKYLQLLIPRRYIRDEVTEFSRAFDDGTVSVNIRSWPECEPRANTLFRIKNVFEVMDKCGDCKFFVSCDSGTVVDKIVDRYGKRVLTYPKRTFVGDRESKEGGQDALIDLLLLAKNRKLKVSYASTFSEMAWWFGGCAAEIEVIDKQSDIDSYLRTLDFRERPPIPEYLAVSLTRDGGGASTKTDIY